MALVDAAYQEFRAKWHLGGQAVWEPHQSIEFITQAMANANRVALKYDFPKSVTEDLEFY
jgi:hypothetical protein